MHITDPIADMLTRIRNANSARHDTVDVPASNMKKSIAQILLDEGYIKSYQIVDDGTQGTIHITLKYNGKDKVITGLRRVSKPGLRVYVGADELPRVLSARHDTVDVPASNMKKSIAQILLDEGYIKSYQIVDDGTQGTIHITLKYNGKDKVITGLRRVSKPGLRVYVGADELPRVLRGLGIAIVSTSKGVMTDKAARAAHIGGEVLAFVW